MLAGLGMFVAAPFVGWWLPKNVSSFGPDVDGLFYLILAITGFFFILTEALLVYFMYAYAGGAGRKENVPSNHDAEKNAGRAGFFQAIVRPVTTVLHDEHRVEMAWTIVPAVILIIIALVQINTWAAIKDPSNMPRDPDVTMVVSARMFEWRVRYPDPQNRPAPEKLGQWSVAPQADDIHVVNEIHAWKGAKVKVFLKTRDVIHSFYLPNLRLKQDALPGKIIPIWFDVTDYNTARDPKTGLWRDSYDPGSDKFLNPDEDHSQVWELACAELCGWGHFKMRGKLFVHKDKADYLAWLKAAQQSQFTTRAEEGTAASTSR
jgi:cytochrome c oxidase subunit 2